MEWKRALFRGLLNFSRNLRWFLLLWLAGVLIWTGLYEVISRFATYLQKHNENCNSYLPGLLNTWRCWACHIYNGFIKILHDASNIRLHSEDAQYLRNGVIYQQILLEGLVGLDLIWSLNFRLKLVFTRAKWRKLGFKA